MDGIPAPRTAADIDLALNRVCWVREQAIADRTITVAAEIARHRINQLLEERHELAGAR